MKKAKKGGICSPGGFCYGFPGPKCAMCCTIFSFFAIVMLLVIGGLVKAGNVRVQQEVVVVADKRDELAHNAFYGCIVYAVFVVGCLGRYLWICSGFRGPMVEVEDDDE
eukprot:TRINITY_DN467_c0_g1_i1.p2 TRINITY_DN467_c0_g1~~TRINITY_DN467_c0_g1_i1.p2  ORF type:complete len:109 (-),score=21.49 TRINITY_DN467_c0_g1_i1:146-472(-)